MLAHSWITWIFAGFDFVSSFLSAEPFHIYNLSGNVCIDTQTCLWGEIFVSEPLQYAPAVLQSLNSLLPVILHWHTWDTSLSPWMMAVSQELSCTTGIWFHSVGLIINCELSRAQRNDIIRVLIGPLLTFVIISKSLNSHFKIGYFCLTNSLKHQIFIWQSYKTKSASNYLHLEPEPKLKPVMYFLHFCSKNYLKDK